MTKTRSLRPKVGLLAATVGTIGLLGCASQLRVVSDKEAIASMQAGRGQSLPLAGVVYFLPNVSYDITVEWSLTKCGSTEVEFAVTVSTTETLAADHSRPYVIDYTALDKRLKHTDLRVQLYDNGTLRSINTSVDDKTREVLTLTAETLARFGMPKDKSVQPQAATCAAGAAKALSLRDELIKQVSVLHQEIDELVATEHLTDSDKVTIRAKKAELALKRESLVRTSEATVFVQKETWMPKGVPECHEVFMDEKGTEKFFRSSGSTLSEETLPVVAVKLEAVPSTGTGNVAAIADEKKNPREHLIYRMPGRAVLKFETRGATEGGAGDVVWKELTRKIVLVPQAGPHMALPLVNRPFGNDTLAAEFSSMGALRKFQYVSAARAAGMVRALREVEGVVGSARERSESRDLEGLEARTALLEAEARLIRAQRELDALRAGEGDQ